MAAAVRITADMNQRRVVVSPVFRNQMPTGTSRA
jgi:hypothetical protein